MSTNQQRLKSAIQRIARSDPQIRSLLKAVEARGDIPASGASASNDAEQDRQCCDGSSSDGGGTPSGGDGGTVGTDTRLPDTGGQSGLDTDNSANLDGMGGGTLDGLVDCETGVPVKFDGNDWMPPEGWDDPANPPIDPTYIEGVYWTWSFDGSSGIVASKSQAISASCGACGACSDSLYDAILGSGRCGPDEPERSQVWTFGYGSCGESNPPAVCDEPPPLAENWPRDGAVSLAIKNGTIVGSKYDPENDGTYSKPKSEISLCDENGNEVNIKPSASGGWKSMDYSRPGDGYLYDGTGKRIARISGSEYSDPNI